MLVEAESRIGMSSGEGKFSTLYENWTCKLLGRACGFLPRAHSVGITTSLPAARSGGLGAFFSALWARFRGSPASRIL